MNPNWLIENDGIWDEDWLVLVFCIVDHMQWISRWKLIEDQPKQKNRCNIDRYYDNLNFDVHSQ